MTQGHIVFGQPQEAALWPEQLPAADLLTQPETAPLGPFRVYFVRGVYDVILSHINETPDVESGGLLVGQAFTAPDRAATFVIVTGAIRQDSDNRSVGHFTVTPREVEAARASLEAYYPGYLAVGWYHSHPGHGVFLSGQDMTIVRSIYNASWQLALVIDPLQKIEGIFVGPEGRLLGGPGRHGYGGSWAELRAEPPTTMARACFNQAQEAAESGRRDVAEAALRRLDGLLRDTPELSHWTVDSYPGLAALRRRVAVLPAKPPAYQTPAPIAPGGNGERGGTAVRRPAGGVSWAGSFFVLAVVLLIFFSAVLLALRQQASSAALIVWGAALTLLVGLGAIVLLNRNRSHAERVMGYSLLGITLLVYTAFILLQLSGRPLAGGATATPPAATTPAQERATSAATAAPAEAATDAPAESPSPTPSSTAEPTGTATVAPTDSPPSPTAEPPSPTAEPASPVPSAAVESPPTPEVIGSPAPEPTPTLAPTTTPTPPPTE